MYVAAMAHLSNEELLSNVRLHNLYEWNPVKLFHGLLNKLSFSNIEPN